MPPIILFDIDGTIYNVDRFRDIYLEKFQTHLGISPNEVIETTNQYKKTLAKSTDFSPRKFLSLISVNHHVPTAELKELYFSPENFSASIFPDVTPVLEKLSKNYTLGIYSEGFPSFQKRKIAPVNKYFKPELTFIVHRKLSPSALRLIPDASFIIDDKTEVITSLSQIPNLYPIWLNRKDSSPHPSASTIHSLSDLPSVLTP